MSFAVNGLAPFFLVDFYKLVLCKIGGVTTQRNPRFLYSEFVLGFSLAKEVCEDKYQDLSCFQHSWAALFNGNKQV